VLDHRKIHMVPLKKFAFVALLSLSSGLPPAIAAHNDPADVAAIREIGEAFHTSWGGNPLGPRDVASGPY